MIGTTISHYRIDEEIGRGGMGVVYKATDTKLDRSVALKFLPKDLSADEEAKVRFIQEAKSASSLDHQNICTIHEIGEDENGTVFIAMAYYEGQTIRKKISDATVGIEDAIDYAIQISKGLAVAHKAEIIHRDIKPGNLMVTGDGVVKILDFGLAKVSGSSITREGKRYGTVLYMSPEQARGERVSPATDLWSLGTVLYEIATGIRPFDAPYESAIFYAIINADPVPPSEHNPDIPPALEQIILRCLEKTISGRYTSAEDLVKDLERLRSGDTAILTTADSEIKKQERKKIKIPLGTAFLFVTLLLLFSIPSVNEWVFPPVKSLRRLNGIAVFSTLTPADSLANLPVVDGIVHQVSNQLLKLERSQSTFWREAYSSILARRIQSSEDAERTVHTGHTLLVSPTVSDDFINLNLSLTDSRSGELIESQALTFRLGSLAQFQSAIRKAIGELIGVSGAQNEGEGQKMKEIDSGLAFSVLEADGRLLRYGTGDNVALAIEMFEFVVKEAPQFAYGHSRLGYAHWINYFFTSDEGAAENALLSLDRAISLDSLSPGYHDLRGTIMARLGRPDEAEFSFRRALSLDSLDRNAYTQLAEALEKRGDLIEAEEVYVASVEAVPNYWMFWKDLGMFYNDHARYAEAAEQFQQVIRLAPLYAWGYNNLAVQYQNLGGMEIAAESLYYQAASVNPDAIRAKAVAFYNLGGINYRRDEFSEAANKYRESLDLDSTYYDGWSDLGNALYWLNDGTGAAQSWERGVILATEALSSTPNSVSALRNLVETYARLGENDQALEAIQKLLDVPGRSPRSLALIGKAYEIMGQRDEALSFILRALDEGYSDEAIKASRWLDELRSDRRYLCRFEGVPC